MSEATVPSPSAAPSPAPVVTTNKTKSTKSGTGTTSNSSSTNRRKGRGGGGGRSRTVIPATDKSAVKFAGICQKALKGWVITWHADNKHLMGKQYHAFLSHLLVACGHVSMEVSISMKQMEAVTILYFRPVLPAAYATANATDKAYYDDILKLDMKKAAENYRTFQQDWYCMFNRIIGQFGPMMVQQLQRSKAWEELERDSDPAELMKLIQKVCVHGGDTAYVPDVFISAIKELFTRKQGSQTPAEYDEQIGSNLDVFRDFVKLPSGAPLFSMFPVLMEHVVETFDEYDFDYADLTSQSTAVQDSVASKCDEVVMGCLVTNNSNQTRSDLLKESRRALLAGQQDAFPTSRVEAMDRLVGYEAIKIKEGKPKKVAVVLVNLPRQAATSTNVFKCWHCDQEGHSCYKCPSLTKAERSALYQQHQSEKAARSASGNNDNGSEAANDGVAVDPVTSAVFAHLGGLQYEDTDDEASEQTFNVSIGGEDTVEDDPELDMEALCFYQVAVENVDSGDDDDDDGVLIDNSSLANENDDDNIIVVNETGVTSTSVVVPPTETSVTPPPIVGVEAPTPNNDALHAYVFDVQNPPPLSHVLARVGTRQHKNNLPKWTRQMTKKLSRSGIETTVDLMSRIHDLNADLQAHGFKTLHQTTLDGLRHALVPGNHSSIVAELSPIIIQDRGLLSDILTSAAVFELMPQPVIASWVNVILYKFSIIGVTNAVELYWGLPELNKRLEAHGLVQLHRSTIYAIRRPLEEYMTTKHPKPSYDYTNRCATDFRQGQV